MLTLHLDGLEDAVGVGRGAFAKSKLPIIRLAGGRGALQWWIRDVTGGVLLRVVASVARVPVAHQCLGPCREMEGVGFRAVALPGHGLDCMLGVCVLEHAPAEVAASLEREEQQREQLQVVLGVRRRMRLEQQANVRNWQTRVSRTLG